jgi:hypothetical protein
MISVLIELARPVSSPSGPRKKDPGLAQEAQRGWGRRQAAIQQQIGDAGLRLDPLGERDIGRADLAEVDDQVGLDGQHHLEIGAAAAAGELAQLRQVARRRREVGQFVRPRRARPASQTLGART